MRFDPTKASQTRFESYGPSHLPNDRDREVELFIEEVESGGAAAVVEASAAASEEGRKVLRAYAERLASLAVRQRQLSLLQYALVALVIGGLDREVREALMIMPLVENSARQLQADTGRFFQSVASLLGPAGSTAVLKWLGRSPEDRTLASMGFVEAEDEGGFRYRLSR